MTTTLAAGRLGLPPPARWNLYDAERTIGWTTESTVGFLGFADQTEAVNAAWVAYRALSRRLARDQGTRLIPIDTATLTVQRQGDRELILADARPIGTLVRPGEHSPAGAHSFAFEIALPEPADELRVRAMAHLMYRTLRKSGLRWALWQSDPRGALPDPSPTREAREAREAREPAARKPVTPSTWAALGLASVSLLVLALVVPKGLGVALAVAGLAALAAFRAAAMTGRRLPRPPAEQRRQDHDETRAARSIAAAG
jgi:hypothetical protein